MHALYDFLHRLRRTSLGQSGIATWAISIVRKASQLGRAPGKQTPTIEPAPAPVAPHIKIGIADTPEFCGLTRRDREQLQNEFGIRDDTLFGMLKQATETGKGIAGFYFELGNTLMNCSGPEEARRYYERVLQWTTDPAIQSMYLQCRLLSPGETNASLLEANRNWATVYETSDAAPATRQRDRDPNRRLRIGYICSFFSNTVMRNGYVDMLRLHDRAAFEVFCYNDGDLPDGIKDCADHWRMVRALSDTELAALIERDKIDILQELNGHCVAHRLGVIVRRPAPVQVTGANHTSTMGMRSFDYIVADGQSILPSEDIYYTENIYRNSTYMFASRYQACDFPDVAPPPSESSGVVTFGYFGAAHKVNRQAIDLWCRVLGEVPNSKFLLKAAAYDHALYRGNAKRQFARNRIGEERLILRGYSPYDRMLEEYAEMDIMLDSFPHTGGSTMIEAIWQGVAPITLEGSRWSSRTGAAILVSGGLGELVAHDDNEFVTRAAELARSPQRLRQYRFTQREKLQNSRLMDVHAFVRDFETAYRFMWRAWCEQQGARSAVPH